MMLFHDGVALLSRIAITRPDAIDIQLLLVCGCLHTAATTLLLLCLVLLTAMRPDREHRGASRGFFHIPRLVIASFSRAIMRKPPAADC